MFYRPLLHSHHRRNIGHDQDHECLCIIIFHPFLFLCELWVFTCLSFYAVLCLPHWCCHKYLTANRRHFRQKVVSWLFSQQQFLWESQISLCFGLNAQPEASLYELARVTNIWVWVWPFAGNALPAQGLWKLVLCFCETLPSGSMSQCYLGLLAWVKESGFWLIMWLCLFHT